MNKPKVLVLATSRKTRGGITSVIKSHQLGSQWEKFNCKWVETHIDRNIFFKFIYFVKGFINYLRLIPFYNIVHIHFSEPPSAIRKLPFFLIAKLFGKKIILHFHSFSIDTTLNGRFGKIYDFLFSNADLTIVLSKYWKDELDNKLKIGFKIKILYNPCNDSGFKRKFNKRKIILYAGTLNSRKGYKDLMNSFALIAKDFPEWKLVFAGNGEISEARKLAVNLNLTDQINFLGWVSSDLKSKIFQEASLFCLPSYAEGFPMAVLDAWSYGIPVITTPVGGLADIVIDGSNSLIFNAGDIPKLTSNLRLLINDELLRNSIIKESLYLAKTVFDPRVINKNLEEIYLKVLED